MEVSSVQKSEVPYNVKKVAKQATTYTAHSISDSIEIKNKDAKHNESVKALSELAPDIRSEKIETVKNKIISGEYDNDVVMDMLINSLINGNYFK